MAASTREEQEREEVYWANMQAILERTRHAGRIGIAISVIIVIALLITIAHGRGGANVIGEELLNACQQAEPINETLHSLAQGAEPEA